MKIRLLLLFAVLWACATVALAQEKTVLIFGDSITAGSALPKDQRSKAWVLVLAEETKGKLKIIPAGKGGRPTDSEAEFKTLLDHYPKADIVVIALGTNDSPHITDDCVPKAVGHLKNMVDMARTAYGSSVSVLLLGPPNLNKDALVKTKPIADQRDAKLKELNAAFETLAKESKCDFLSLYGVVPATSLTVDGIHPDAAGNAAMVQVILPKLLPAK